MSDLSNEEVEAVVAEATSENNFDALAFFSGAALPEDSIIVHANSKAAYRLSEIREKLEQQAEREKEESISITDEVYYVDEDEIADLKSALTNSAVHFKLRGLAPAAKTAIEKKVRASNPYTEGGENTAYNEAFNANLIASTIVSVSNATGQMDPNKWNSDRVLAFSKVAAESEFSKLYLGVLKVNYIGDAIDRAVSADFS